MYFIPIHIIIYAADMKIRWKTNRQIKEKGKNEICEPKTVYTRSKITSLIIFKSHFRLRVEGNVEVEFINFAIIINHPPPTVTKRCHIPLFWPVLSRSFNFVYLISYIYIYSIYLYINVFIYLFIQSLKFRLMQ